MPEEKHHSSKRRFAGYHSPNYTMVPDELFDEQLPDLTGAELKVLLYIIRRTFGFKRASDHISLAQMLSGITTRDGRVLDRGTGLSKKSLLQSLRNLEEMNLILREQRRSAERGDEPTSYRLNVVAAHHEEQTTPPVGEKLHQGGGGESTPGPWGKNYTTQETVRQETVEQETVGSNDSDSENQDQDLSNRGVQGGRQPRPGDNPATATRSGLTSVAEALQRRRQLILGQSPEDAKPARKRSKPPATAYKAAGRPPKAPVWLEAMLEQWSAIDFHDADHTRPNIGQTARLWKASGLSDEAFRAKLYEARTITLKRSGSITKQASDSAWAKNRAPYFFSVLRDLLGMKEQQGSGPSPPVPL